MEKQSVNSCLESILRRHAPEFVAPPAGDGFNEFFSALGWRLRRRDHVLADAERKFLQDAGLLVPEALGLDGIARIHALLHMVVALPWENHVEWIAAVFRRGDNGEREAMLHALVLLPEPGRFLSTAVDACRAAVQTTFEAMACDNAYPAGYFPPDAYRAMVLKALHLGVPVERIHGLEARADAELGRMAADYAAELRAAGRPVPADVVFIEKQ
jgi:hypothetical protein